MMVFLQQVTKTTTANDERSMDKEGVGRMNENGEKLANMYSTNYLVIGGTLFKHKEVHKITWNSPLPKKNVIKTKFIM